MNDIIYIKFTHSLSLQRASMGTSDQNARTHAAPTAAEMDLVTLTLEFAIMAVRTDGVIRNVEPL